MFLSFHDGGVAIRGQIPGNWKPSQQTPALRVLAVPICPGPRGEAIPLISGQLMMLMSASRILQNPRILQKVPKPADTEKQLGSIWEVPSDESPSETRMSRLHELWFIMVPKGLSNHFQGAHHGHILLIVSP